MTTRRNIKYRYLKTKMALSQTVQSILDINRKRRFVEDNAKGKKDLDEELKVLNAVAENHARVLKSYEQQMASVDVPVNNLTGSAVTPSFAPFTK